MNPYDEKQLEAQVDRVLKRLPGREAPATLLPRVLQAVARQAALPWYRRPWITWPGALQGVSLAGLAALFAALCYAGWQLPNLPALAEAARGVREWFSAVNVAESTLAALGRAALYCAQHLGPLFIGGCVMAAVIGYACCIGFGTLYVRLTLSRR